MWLIFKIETVIEHIAQGDRLTTYGPACLTVLLCCLEMGCRVDVRVSLTTLSFLLPRLFVGANGTVSLLRSRMPATSICRGSGEE